MAGCDVLVRLQKFLAEAGLGSRRHCETLITAGKVKVNGQPATTLGTKIESDTDRVSVAGKPVRIERKVYIALNKPAGYLCTSRDTEGRRTVHELLPGELPRLYTVGRLDCDTDGLLFLTNDGTFSLRLTHPRYKMPKTYRVEVVGELTAAETTQLLQGVRSDGELLCAEKIFDVRHAGDATQLHVVLREGKKRQVRRMLAAVGHPVTRLTRLSIGSITLGKLNLGQWRYLTDEEVRQLVTA
ncbi:MAG: pseudouridine synthase [Verrucomicrobiota bacterium]